MRKRLVKLLIVLIGFFAAGVETARANPAHPDLIQPRSTSPFEIARAVNRSRRAWNKSQIMLDVDLSDTWQQLGIDGNQFPGCAGDCEAVISRTELDPSPGRELILKLTQSYNFCRYLIFVRDDKIRAGRVKWKLRGYIDHDFNKYEMSSYRVVQALGKNWLVVRGQEGSGSGYSLYSETWYQVSRKGIEPVLHYPVEGHTYPWPTGVGREFKARVLSSRDNHLRLGYTVTYTSLDYVNQAFEKLFVNHHHVYYSLSQQTQKLVLDKKRSDISAAEIDAIADIQSDDEPQAGTKIGGTTFYTLAESKAFVGGGYEVFLKYNSRHLMKIAAGRDEARKQWLRELLNECEDTSEKKALLEALQKQ
ncbi:MAG TPA: hypothetical protein VN696_02070 [Pyrinomonadaceae bacterium]|nr:hypothetical protein [Pyrinomonadaceae bacterium]